MFTVFTVPVKANLNFKTVFDLLNKPKPSFTIGEGNIKKLNRVINVKKNGKKNENKNKDGIN